jgi:hypothetical protein
MAAHQATERCSEIQRLGSFILASVHDIDDNSATLSATALGALRKIKGPFTEDYAVEQVMKTGASRVEAEACLKHMINDGLLAKDPEGYLRLVK